MIKSLHGQCPLKRKEQSQKMKDRVFSKITMAAAFVDIASAIAFFVVQIINLIKTNTVSYDAVRVFLIISAVAIIVFLAVRVVGIAIGAKSPKVITLIAYAADLAWVIAMIFVLKNLRVF